MRERLLVVADTHGITTQVKKFVHTHGPFTGLIHLGDYVEDGQLLAQKLALPLYVVAGNGDGKHLVQERTVLVGGHKVLLAHGHRLNLMDEENLWRLAQAKGVDALLFGHTHRPYHRYQRGIHVANPGSPTLPRGGYAPSVMILEVKDGELFFTHMAVTA